MAPDVARAVVDTAHAAHRPVFAHPSTTQGIEIALQAVVDVLAHSTPIDGPWPDGMAQRLVAADMALVPSLKLFEVELRKESVPPAVIERFLAVGQGQLRAFRQAGGDGPGGRVRAKHVEGIGFAMKLIAGSARPHCARARFDLKTGLHAFSHPPVRGFAASHHGRVKKFTDWPAAAFGHRKPATP